MTVFRNSGAASAVSASGTSNSTTLNGSGDVIRVVNESNTDGYVNVGVGSATASASNLYIAPLSTSFFRIDFADDTIAVVSGGGTIVIHVNRGSAG